MPRSSPKNLTNDCQFYGNKHRNPSQSCHLRPREDPVGPQSNVQVAQSYQWIQRNQQVAEEIKVIVNFVEKWPPKP